MGVQPTDLKSQVSQVYFSSLLKSVEADEIIVDSESRGTQGGSSTIFMHNLPFLHVEKVHRSLCVSRGTMR